MMTISHKWWHPHTPITTNIWGCPKMGVPHKIATYSCGETINYRVFRGTQYYKDKPICVCVCVRFFLSTNYHPLLGAPNLRTGPYFLFWWRMAQRHIGSLASTLMTFHGFQVCQVTQLEGPRHQMFYHVLFIFSVHRFASTKWPWRKKMEKGWVPSFISSSFSSPIPLAAFAVVEVSRPRPLCQLDLTRSTRCTKKMWGQNVSCRGFGQPAHNKWLWGPDVATWVWRSQRRRTMD